MPDQFAKKYDKPIQLPDGKITMRIITYRGEMPMGHLIILKPEDLKKRAK
jgi:hexosaminidase